MPGYALERQLELLVDGTVPGTSSSLSGGVDRLSGKVDLLLAGVTSDTLIFPPLEWAVFSILAEAAITNQPGAVAAFRGAAALAAQLKSRRVVSDADPDQVIQLVARIRSRVDKSALVADLRAQGALLPGQHASVLLVQRVQNLGYRLGVPPERILWNRNGSLLGPAGRYPPPSP